MLLSPAVRLEYCCSSGEIHKVLRTLTKHTSVFWYQIMFNWTQTKNTAWSSGQYYRQDQCRGILCGSFFFPLCWSTSASLLHKKPSRFLVMFVQADNVAFPVICVEVLLFEPLSIDNFRPHLHWNVIVTDLSKLIMTSWRLSFLANCYPDPNFVSSPHLSLCVLHNWALCSHKLISLLTMGCWDNN